jgi:beta-galactosidase
MNFRNPFHRSRLQLIPIVACVLLGTNTAAGQVSSTYREDKISLDGAWKFQLRHDNQLTSSGEVKFGPVTASSQAYLNPPPTPETPSLAWLKMEAPWGLAATLAGPPTASDYARLVWRPNSKQQGPTWWQADLGSKQTLAMVRIHWAKPGSVAVTLEISDDGKHWTPWSTGKSKPEEAETSITGALTQAEFLRLTFTPGQFEGTRTIDVYWRDADGQTVLWQPEVRKSWYEELRRFTPADGFELPSFQDSQWSSIQVPGYWETQGFGEPTWYQPNDEVGYYRRTFSVPTEWQGRRVRLRFEGANNGAQIWVNGKEVGYHESGFTAFEFDVTPLLHFGAANLITARVSKWTLTADYDTDDVYFLGGLWRDVYLYSLPADRIEDFWMRTEFDPVYRNAVLRVQMKLQGAEAASERHAVVEGSLIDAEGKEISLPGLRAEVTLAGRDATPMELASVVENPHKWTAETPYLYSLVLRLKIDGHVVQEFKNTVGFRQVEVQGSRIVVNGVRIEIRGVVTTRANPTNAGESREKIFAREIRLLKEGNINAIRSHTTPLEEDFLSLCDRAGIYVMPDVPYVWVPEGDFRYLTDGVVARARDVFEQHKNHPSVILWHVGNENAPTTAYLGGGQAARWLHETDPTRPVGICRNFADFKELGTDFSDLHYDPKSYPEFREMYPTPILFGEFHAVPNEIDRLKDQGFVETWGRSLQQEWAAFLHRYYYVVGGLICCWDDGIVNGNLGANQWGVVDSKRQAKPVYYYIRKAYAPVKVELASPSFDTGHLVASVKVSNLYNFINLDGFKFEWLLEKAGQPVATVHAAYRVEPMTNCFFPLSLKAASGADRLRVSVFDSGGYSIVDEEFPLPVPAAPSTINDLLKKIGASDGKTLKLKEGAKGVHTGSFVAHWDEGPSIHLQDRSGQELLTLSGFAMQAEKSAWTSMEVGPVTYQPSAVQQDSVVIPFSVSGNTKEKRTKWQVPGTIKAEFSASSVRVTYTLEPTSDISIPEAGIRLMLGAQLSHLSWNRDALWSVPPRNSAEGFLEQHIPLTNLQETGSKRRIYWVSADSAGTEVLLVPLGPSTNLRSGESSREIILSDFLSSGNFLGKFDRETAEKKLAAGEKFQGGFTLYFLTKEQQARFLSLADAEKDLTWERRVRAESALQ